jgi:hypothetical protein
MTSNGAAAYASNKEFRTGKVVDFFAAREGREAHLVLAANWCGERPDWLIIELRSEPPATVEHAPGCDLVYDHVETSDPWGLSGIAWALYRKREAVPSAQVLSELDARRLTPVIR